jgi:hypothetical protein
LISRQRRGKSRESVEAYREIIEGDRRGTLSKIEIWRVFNKNRSKKDPVIS